MLATCCLTGHPLVAPPKGKIETISGLPCYVVGEENSDAIVIGPDVFALAPHLKTLSDSFASLGFSVYAVDYFNGGGLPPILLEKLLPIFSTPEPGVKPPPKSFVSKAYTVLLLVWCLISHIFHIVPFLWNHGKTSYTKKIATLTDIAKTLGRKKKNVAFVGYCYGGTIGVKMAAIPEIPFKTISEVHGQVTLEDVYALKKPTIFCCASNDHAFPDDRIAQAQKILREKFPQNLHKIIQYPGTYHGFAIRGDDRKEHIAKAKDKCMHDVAEFFTKIQQKKQYS